MQSLLKARRHIRFLIDLTAGLYAAVGREFLHVAEKLGYRKHVLVFAGMTSSAGLFTALHLAFLRVGAALGIPEPATFKIGPRQVAHPVEVRLRGSSDLHCFDQIFILQEYACLRDLAEPLVILDMGANIGLSAVFFLNAFPKARVLALEPDKENFLMCKNNLLPYGERALLFQGAVWSRPTTLRLVKAAFGDGLEWATQVDELTEEDEASDRVQAWDVQSLIDKTGCSTVDLLKIDIERAELIVFGGAANRWLKRIRNICIELHGKDCEYAFFTALKDFDYELESSGELTICRNLVYRDTLYGERSHA